jgi:hypothetical protein
VDYCERPDQGCYRLGVVTIGSKDIVLEYTVPKALYPAAALYRGSIGAFAENGFGVGQVADIAPKTPIGSAKINLHPLIHINKRDTDRGTA